MRDEDEIQNVADKAASLVRAAAPQAKTDYLRGVRDALDWVLDEDMEDDPL